MKNGDYSTNCRVLPLVCEPKISIEEATIDYPKKNHRQKREHKILHLASGCSCAEATNRF